MTRLVFTLDALPLEEAVPVGRQRADAAVGAIARDQQRVEHEQCRHAVQRMLVTRDVVVEGLARLEEAVRQLTSKPADIYRIPDRGRIAVGGPADLMLFDPAKPMWSPVLV